MVNMPSIGWQQRCEKTTAVAASHAIRIEGTERNPNIYAKNEIFKVNIIFILLALEAIVIVNALADVGPWN